jgi:hypothetical protein
LVSLGSVLKRKQSTTEQTLESSHDNLFYMMTFPNHRASRQLYVFYPWRRKAGKY